MLGTIDFLRPWLFTICASLALFGSAQEPFASTSKAGEVLTASQGVYPEVFANDTIRRIGSFMFNTRTRKAYQFGLGMEKDDEIRGATGTSYDVGARLYDPMVGRWLSLDPLATKYPGLSPYCFVGDMPIIAIDPDGKKIIVHYSDAKGRDKTVVIKKMTDVDTKLLAKANTTNNQFLKDVYETLTYLKDEAVVQESVSSKTGVDVRQTEGHSDYGPGVNPAYPCVPLTHNVSYNSREGVEVVSDSESPKMPGDRTGTGQIQSPALGFLHELGHFLDVVHSPDYNAHDERQSTSVPLWDNAEEQRNIMEVETPAAIRLGEPTRTNHAGIAVEVANPTSRSSIKAPIKQHDPIHL